MTITTAVGALLIRLATVVIHRSVRHGAPRGASPLGASPHGVRCRPSAPHEVVPPFCRQRRCKDGGPRADLRTWMVRRLASLCLFHTGDSQPACTASTNKLGQPCMFTNAVRSTARTRPHPGKSCQPARIRDEASMAAGQWHHAWASTVSGFSGFRHTCQLDHGWWVGCQVSWAC